MLHDNMNLSRLMVHAQQVEESRFKRKKKDEKRARPHYGGTSKECLKSKTSQSLRRGFPTKFLLISQGLTRIGCLTLIHKEERLVVTSNEIPNCTKYVKRHMGKCLMGSSNCFGCGNSGHMVRDFSMEKIQGRESNHAQASGPSSDAPKICEFFVLGILTHTPIGSN